VSPLSFVDRPDPNVVRMNVLLYGSPKTGKTAGAATAPGPTLLVNADLPNASRIAHRVAGDRLRELAWPEEGGVLQTMIDVHHVVYGQDPPDTVIVDTVGDLHRRLLEDLAKRAIRPTLNAYGDTIVHIERFCRMLCEAPVNAIFVAHEWPVHNEDGTVDKLLWAGTKSSSESFSQKLMGMVDVVGYTAIMDTQEGRQYVAQLVTQSGRRGGDRFSALGDWQPVNIENWIRLVQAAEASALGLVA
jgi:hypothetical protein